jgi:tetratricopeptide (TPR) repeat protein
MSCLNRQTGCCAPQGWLWIVALSWGLLAWPTAGWAWSMPSWGKPSGITPVVKIKSATATTPQKTPTINPPIKDRHKTTKVVVKTNRATLAATPDPAKGIEAYNKGVELFQIAQGQAEKGNLSGQQALLAEAAKQFKLALRLTPNMANAQSNLGFVDLTLRRYSQAIKAFEQALKLDPKHPNTLNGLGTAYTLVNKPSKALATYSTLLNYAPDNSQYWYNRGCVYQKMGQFASAQADYQKALLLTPNDQRTLFNLGVMADDEQHIDEAIARFTQAKNAGIDTPIGLEAYRRLERLKQIKPAVPVNSSRATPMLSGR